MQIIIGYDTLLKNLQPDLGYWFVYRRKENDWQNKVSNQFNKINYLSSVGLLCDQTCLLICSTQDLVKELKCYFKLLIIKKKSLIELEQPIKLILT